MKPSLTPCLLVLAAVPFCVACNGQLDAGLNNLEPEEAGSCKALTLGQATTPGNAGECGNYFIGRWQLCSDTGSTDVDSGLGFGAFVPQPGGIEFAQENGALRVYMLVPSDGGGLVRADDPSEQAAATEPDVLGSACKFWMAPDIHPSEQTGWTVARYTDPNALLINGTATYVPADPPQ
jgi:hypothetical protein